MAGGGESYNWNHSSNNGGDHQEDDQSRILNNNVSDIIIHGDHDLRTNFNNGVRLVSTVINESSHDHHQPPGNQIKLNPQEDCPLGLRLRRSESLLSLIQSRLTIEKLQKKPPRPEKYKAANFHGVSIKIGSWKWLSRNPGDLVAKIYYLKKKLVWEFLLGGLKKKMEISWSAISAINVSVNQGENGRLEIELSEPPQFGQEINCQKGKHTQWTITTDFTENQALICRRHTMECLPGVINKHFEQLIQRDKRLFHLSQQPFPIHNSPFFPTSCLNFSHNYNVVGSSSSVPIANCHHPAFLSHVQINIAPQTSPFVPHSDSNLPSSALNSSIPQEMQMSVAVYEQRRNLSSIPIGEQDFVLPYGPESWIIQDPLPELENTNMENLVKFSNEEDGCRIDSTIKGGHHHMMISCNGIGFSNEEHNPGLAVEARMDEFSNDISAANHMAYLDNQSSSFKDLELINVELGYLGPSSSLPSQEVNIHDFNYGGGMNQMGHSGNNMVCGFDPSTGICELSAFGNYIQEVDKNDQSIKSRASI